MDDCLCFCVYIIVNNDIRFWRLQMSRQIVFPRTEGSRKPRIQTCQVSSISRETHAFSMSLALSLRTVEISRIFLLNEKQYF